MADEVTLRFRTYTDDGGDLHLVIGYTPMYDAYSFNIYISDAGSSEYFDTEYRSNYGADVNDFVFYVGAGYYDIMVYYTDSSGMEYARFDLDGLENYEVYNPPTLPVYNSATNSLSSSHSGYKIIFEYEPVDDTSSYPFSKYERDFAYIMNTKTLGDPNWRRSYATGDGYARKWSKKSIGISVEWLTYNSHFDTEVDRFISTVNSNTSLDLYRASSNGDISVRVGTDAQLGTRDGILGSTVYSFGVPGEIIGADIDVWIVPDELEHGNKDTMYHELYHAIGCFSHTWDYDSLMYYLDKPMSYELTSLDMALLRLLYDYDIQAGISEFDFASIINSVAMISTTGTSVTLKGLINGKQYRARAWYVSSYGPFSLKTSWVTFTANVPPTVSILSPEDGLYTKSNSITVKAKSVGAAYVNFYNSALGTLTDNTPSSGEFSVTFDISGLADGFYDFAVRAYNSTGASSNQVYVGIWVDRTGPTVSISAYSDAISVSWSDAYDAGVGLSGVVVELRTLSGTVLESRTYYNATTGTHYFSYMPSAGQTYRIYVTPFDILLNYGAADTQDVTVTSSRPPNWKWTTNADTAGHISSGAVLEPYSPGYAIAVGAQEWNNFQKRINAFRSYYNGGSLPLYTFYSYFNGEGSFTTPPGAGSTLDYFYFNQANNAISKMRQTYISNKSSGDAVTTADLNALMDTLNAIV